MRSRLLSVIQRERVGNWSDARKIVTLPPANLKVADFLHPHLDFPDPQDEWEDGG